MRKIFVQTISVSGIEGAIKGMRAPLQSYEKSDTKGIEIGEKDLELANRLKEAGPEHRKFLRMIHVQAIATLPRYQWSEYDTYKISTVANSESTMHKLLNNNAPITEELFFFGDDVAGDLAQWSIEDSIYQLEFLRKIYKKLELTEEEMETIFYQKAKDLSKDELLVVAKRILPECWLQTRYIDLNYETLRTIYHQRKNHRLKEEWGIFCEWIESLPYAKEFLIN